MQPTRTNKRHTAHLHPFFQLPAGTPVDTTCPASEKILSGVSIYTGGVVAAQVNVSSEAACCALCNSDYKDECAAWEWIDQHKVSSFGHNCDIFAQSGPVAQPYVAVPLRFFGCWKLEDIGRHPPSEAPHQQCPRRLHSTIPVMLTCAVLITPRISVAKVPWPGGWVPAIVTCPATSSAIDGRVSDNTTHPRRHLINSRRGPRWWYHGRSPYRMPKVPHTGGPLVGR